LIYILIATVILLVGGYALAWLSAMRLTQAYFVDAETSFENGEYLNALTGYSEYVEATGRNEFRGGYSQIVNIWADRYAVPAPGEVTTARERIDTIINQHLTIDEAERFVQRNIGRSNPYIGPIYLRLGELYEAEGDLDTAEEIYADVIDSFRTDTTLVEQAQAHLDRLAEAEDAGSD
jgi:tetratricopeptide (TPR) repeat protein